VRGQEESAIVHGIENAAEAPRAYNRFSANGNTPLRLCLSLGVHPTFNVTPASVIHNPCPCQMAERADNSRCDPE
jgi:hypothetical protein